jgi:hypothetical protein
MNKKGLEKCGRGLIEVLSWELNEATETNHGKYQSG